MTKTSRSLCSLGLVFALGLVACGDDDDSGAAGSAGSSASGGSGGSAGSAGSGATAGSSGSSGSGGSGGSSAGSSGSGGSSATGGSAGSGGSVGGSAGSGAGGTGAVAGNGGSAGSGATGGTGATAGAGGTGAGGTGAVGGSAGSGGSGPATPDVQASNQSLDLTTVITVDSITAVVDGWITIHEDDGSGGIGAVVGVAPVAVGTHTNVRVGIDRRAADGEVFHPMLHIDAGQAGVYEFPGEDVPENAPVPSLTVTVAAGTPDVRINISASSASSYATPTVEPSNFESVIVGAAADASGDNAINLYRFWRYEVVNSASGGHPLQLLMTVGNTDTVLGSQNSAGALEAVPSVDWAEDGNAFRFTVSADLEMAGLNKYRCAIHTTSMRGDITLTDEP